MLGKYRRRLTYDELIPTHFIAGCIKGAFDLPQRDREAKLIYLANLLEDASDFGMENAKACHAVVLTEMEQGKCEWTNRESLDRFRRCHAQRHDPPTKINVQTKQKSNNNHLGNKNQQTGLTLICRYWNENKCKIQKSHNAGGNFYRHVCSSCDGKHKLIHCPKN